CAVERQRQMLARPQDLADRGGETAARAVLDEDAHAVRPCLLDDAWENERLQGLAREGLGHRVGGRLEDAAERVRIETHWQDRLERLAAVRAPPRRLERR